jgi:hypothetical protein
MLSRLPVKVLDGKLSKIDELELRLINLEALVKEIKSEILLAREEVKEEDLKKIDKLSKYQKLIDHMWSGNRSSAV